jgi:hypothetical protein
MYPLDAEWNAADCVQRTRMAPYHGDQIALLDFII